MLQLVVAWLLAAQLLQVSAEASRPGNSLLDAAVVYCYSTAYCFAVAPRRSSCSCATRRWTRCAAVLAAVLLQPLALLEGGLLQPLALLEGEPTLIQEIELVQLLPPP